MDLFCCYILERDHYLVLERDKYHVHKLAYGDLKMEKCQSLLKRSPDNSLQDWVAFMRKVKKTISLIACHWKEDKGTRERIKVSKKHKRCIHGKSWFDHWKGNRWKKSHYKKTKNPTVEKEWSNSHGEKWDHIKTLKSSLDKKRKGFMTLTWGLYSYYFCRVTGIWWLEICVAFFARTQLSC